MIGELIGHYRVLELLGRGAMGVVYKALDVNLDRPVAIKVMSVEARSDPDFVERFRQEARMQGALNHPNIALLFDYFIHNDAPVAVIEFIDGETLEHRVKRCGRIPAHECVPIFKQALRGVAAAHRAGIIHRDLKTANLMITKDDIVKVMDFGIAKRQGSTAATKASTSIGSPLFMAPEQILGRAVDCRTDVYALGVTLYQLLCGQPPFNPRGKTEYSVLNAHVNDLPESPTVHCRDIPQPIVDALMRSLAKQPAARFQSVDDFMRALPDVSAPNTAAPQPDSSHTVALEYSAPIDRDPVASDKPSGTMVFEYAPSTRPDPRNSMAFDYSSATLRQELSARRSAPPSASTTPPGVRANAAPAGRPVTARPDVNSTPPSTASAPTAQGLRGARPGVIQRPRTHRRTIVAVLVAIFVLGTLIHHAQRTRLKHEHTSTAATTQTQTRVSSERAAPPPAAMPISAPEAPPARPTNITAATAVPASATPLTETTTPARPDLSGTWRGEYVDASGKQLLRVVSLSINRVHDDGGIEGKLRYEAASGEGECHLDPSGSTWSADERRLQLSPAGCSPHSPKELAVPLDFAGVNPQANTLKDGRIEAPTGEAIRVKLKRVSAAG